jgi:ribosomal protein S18 acetylase RimI-like enzyme
MSVTTPAVLTIRACRPGDEAALALVGQATFLETFAGILDGGAVVAHCNTAHAPDVYAGWLRDDRFRLWLVGMEPGGAPVGFMVVAPADLPLPDLGPGDLEIKRIYLLSRFQGTGMGRRLVETAQAAARELSARRLLLGVYAHNAAAIGFYRRMGFSQLGARTFNVGGRAYDDHIMGQAVPR